MDKHIAKSMLIWLSITPLAILNGGLREYVLLPRLGAIAVPISGILLTLCIIVVSYIFLPRLGSAKKSTYVKMGIIWLIATVVFEFMVGVVTKTPLSEMLRAYDFTTGNLWLFIVIFIGFVPTIVAKLKRLSN